MGYKSKVLEVHIYNPRMMSVGEDNKRQTDRQTYSINKKQSHIKSVRASFTQSTKVSVSDNNNRQIDI